MTQLLPPKKEVALALLERSNVDVYLDPRAKGVVVPPQFRKEPRLILKIGLNMPVPIPDLRLDDESLSCTLSFSRSPFYCVVPWPSVFAMVGDDGRGMVWPDDVPQELAVRVVEDGADGAPKAEESSPIMGSERSERGAKKRGRGRDAGDESRPSLREAPERPSREPQLAEVERPANAKGGSGGKRGKKKKEAERPMLVAVPSGPPRDRVDEKRKEKEKERPLADSRPKNGRPSAPSTPNAGAPPSRAPGPPNQGPPSGAPRPSGPGTPASNRPKRELPPYLRVVK